MTFRRKATVLLAALAATGASMVVAGQTQAARPHQVVPVTNYTVTAGWGNDDYAANIFTPSTLQIYVGDSVTWMVRGKLEPHTITFGPMKMLAQIVKNQIQIVPQKAGPPQVSFNNQFAYPTPNHTYAGSGYRNSGVLITGRKYTLRFTRAGTYRYYCLIHFPGMFGQVVVNPRPAPSSTFVVRSGYGSDRSAADAFFPENVTIHVGQSVMWTPGFHTVTFAPQAYIQNLRRQYIVAFPRSRQKPQLGINPAVAFPMGGATYGGVGVWSSGLLIKGPAHLTFTRPGVYHYSCLIHPGMDGTVTVVP